MDPYLEGYLWPDVHHALADNFRRQLTPRLKPRYVARLEIYVLETIVSEDEARLMYPDVEILASESDALREPLPVWEDTLENTLAPEYEPPIPPPVIIPVLEEVRLAAVQVRDVAHNRLVTRIEILSPVNKREPGLAAYRRKRRRLRQAGVHLLEIDLLRRGTRLCSHPRFPQTPYLVTLTRAASGAMEAWPIKLQDPLPAVPVPLLPPDPDVPLDLGRALATVYDEAAYELSIDYEQPPPPPPLSDEESAWVKTMAQGK
jgi:hypothetical protein